MRRARLRWYRLESIEFHSLSFDLSTELEKKKDSNILISQLSTTSCQNACAILDFKIQREQKLRIVMNNSDHTMHVKIEKDVFS